MLIAAEPVENHQVAAKNATAWTNLLKDGKECLSDRADQFMHRKITWTTNSSVA